ncbi:hypothetical protein [Streptomyces sp. NPDC003635]
MEIAPELLMALASGTAGAAGQQVWESLRRLVGRRPTGEAPSAEEELTALAEHADDTERARELANVLALRAAQDHPEFARALDAWRGEAEAWRESTARATGSGDTHNEVRGGDFRGPVIQARDINGPLDFGR